MENNKELELLREYFALDEKKKVILAGNQLELRVKILEIQKQNKLKDKVEKFRVLISESWIDNEKFNEILKELELLREFFENDNTIGCVSKNEELKEQILEIQKQRKLQNDLKVIRYLPREIIIKLEEILKELGYEH